MPIKKNSAVAKNLSLQYRRRTWHHQYHAVQGNWKYIAKSHPTPKLRIVFKETTTLLGTILLFVQIESTHVIISSGMVKNVTANIYLRTPSIDRCSQGKVFELTETVIVALGPGTQPHRACNDRASTLIKRWTVEKLDSKRHRGGVDCKTGKSGGSFSNCTWWCRYPPPGYSA